MQQCIGVVLSSDVLRVTAPELQASGSLLQRICPKTSQSPGGQLCCSKDKMHIVKEDDDDNGHNLCGEGMARGVSSASPGIPFLQVPWPFLMLSTSIQVGS